MKLFFKELFAYNQHFNQKLSDVFRDNSDITSEKAVKLFNHIINAHQIWNSRIEKNQIAIGVWEIREVHELKNIDQTNYQRSLQILDKLDLNETIHYSNSKGQAFSSSVQDMLFHVINHSTYHRGQIATEFKLFRLEPLATDYIFYKR